MEFIDKYQPKQLADLIGQDAVIRSINNMIKNKRIPRQILITGETGVGKTATARLLAYLFNDIKFGRPLPDLLEKDIGDERGIDAIREIAASANFAPHRKYRVIILDEIHRLTSQAAPALLKPLQDTSPQTIWILVTNQPHLLLPTIIRRCYPLPLKHPSPAELLPLLQKICRREQLELPRQNKLLQTLADTVNGQPALGIYLLQAVADAATPDVSYKEILRAALAASPAFTNANLAVKCLVYLYHGKPQQVLLTLKSGGEPIPFVNALLQMNQWLLDQQIARSTWQSPLTAKLAKYTAQIKLPELIVMHNHLVDLRGEIQRFIFPEAQLLMARLANLALTQGKSK
jgi:DNA polymerase III gamma/tau subunit